MSVHRVGSTGPIEDEPPHVSSGEITGLVERDRWVGRLEGQRSSIRWCYGTTCYRTLTVQFPLCPGKKHLQGGVSFLTPQHLKTIGHTKVVTKNSGFKQCRAEEDNDKPIVTPVTHQQNLKR